VVGGRGFAENCRVRMRSLRSPVPTATLRWARIRVFLGDLPFTGAKRSTSSAWPWSVLRPFGAFHDQPGRLLEMSDGRSVVFTTLYARSGGAAKRDFRYSVFDFDVHTPRPGQHGDREGAGVDGPWASWPDASTRWTPLSYLSRCEHFR